METTPPDPQVGDTLGGCRLEALAFEDTTYLVFKAMHQTLRRPAAIRVLRSALGQEPALAAAFEQAGRTQPGVLNIGCERGVRFAEISAKGDWPDLQALSQASGEPPAS